MTKISYLHCIKSIVVLGKYMIQVRYPIFNFTENLPIYYRFNNLYRNYLVNSLHILFPDGENYFIRSIQGSVKNLKDVILKDRVKKFIGQEIQHSLAHKSIHQVLIEQGYSVIKYRERFNKYILFIEKWAKKIVRNNKLNIAIVAGCEHHTAISSEYHLKYVDTIDRKIGTPFELSRLLVWHTIEEIEHKDVAFDVMKAYKIGYFIRIFGFILASLLFTYFTLSLSNSFRKEDSIYKKTPFAEKVKHFITFHVHSVQFYKLTFIRSLQYFKPGFHPLQIKENIDINSFIEYYNL